MAGERGAQKGTDIGGGSPPATPASSSLARQAFADSLGAGHLNGGTSLRTISRWRDRRPTLGAVVWVVQRISSVLLLVLVPLKVISGWAFRGAMPGEDVMSAIHTSGAIDVVLIAAVAFHAFFGIRTLMIDFGRVRAAERLTIPFAVFATVITVWGAVIAL